MGRIYTARRNITGGLPAASDMPGLIGDYDPSVGITIVTGVSNWADSSVAASAALVQATVAEQPAFVASARNGLPGISFDGTDDSLLGGLASIVQPTDVFLVAKWDDATTGQTIIDGSSVNNRRLFRTGATTLAMFAGTQLNITGVTPESYHVHRLTFNGTLSAYAEDGVAQAPGNAGAGGSTGISVGKAGVTAGSCAKCTVLRLRVFQGILSPANAVAELNYLRNRHGI